MSDFCAWIRRVLRWMDRGGMPVIPQVALVRGAFRSAPAPHLEICYMVQGEVDGLRIGDLRVRIPERHATLHSVHFGNFSPPFEGPTWIWCAFLDVSDASAFRDLRHKPMFSCGQIHNPRTVCAAFEKLSVLCRRGRKVMPRYPTGPVAFAPSASRDRPAPHDVRVKAALFDLLGCLLEGAERTSGHSEEFLPEPVRRALQFMGVRYADPDLRLEDIAGAAHLSVDHFGRVFKQNMHRTPIQHLNAVRVEEAQILLRQTQLLVEEVAWQVGFQSPFHFSRTFRRITGLSPTAFRERGPTTS